MECYRIHIPDGVKVQGVDAVGRACTVLPGEYLAHPLRPRLPEVFRLVGADASGRDVHVAKATVLRFVEPVGQAR